MFFINYCILIIICIISYPLPPSPAQASTLTWSIVLVFHLLQHVRELGQFIDYLSTDRPISSQLGQCLNTPSSVFPMSFSSCIICRQTVHELNTIWRTLIYPYPLLTPSSVSSSYVNLINSSKTYHLIIPYFLLSISRSLQVYVNLVNCLNTSYQIIVLLQIVRKRGQLFKTSHLIIQSHRLHPSPYLESTWNWVYFLKISDLIWFDHPILFRKYLDLVNCFNTLHLIILSPDLHPSRLQNVCENLVNYFMAFSHLIPSPHPSPESTWTWSIVF